MALSHNKVAGVNTHRDSAHTQVTEANTHLDLTHTQVARVNTHHAIAHTHLDKNNSLTTPTKLVKHFYRYQHHKSIYIAINI
jgi:hypothetical protein